MLHTDTIICSAAMLVVVCAFVNVAIGVTICEGVNEVGSVVKE